jgi:hypothetical protein
LISKRKIKQSVKPWITKGIKKSIKIKNKLFCSGNKEKYRLYRNKITNLTRMSKRFYFEEYFLNNLKNIRKTWEGINNLINRKKKSLKLVTKMRCPIKNEIATSPTEISNIFNKHFSYIGRKLAAKSPNSSKHFSYYLNTNNYPNSLFLNLLRLLKFNPKSIQCPVAKQTVFTLVPCIY